MMLAKIMNKVWDRTHKQNNGGTEEVLTGYTCDNSGFLHWLDQVEPTGQIQMLPMDQFLLFLDLPMVYN